ncbi:glycosyltransferase [Prevotella sp. E15-22]|uniref:glycosyltransferase family 2 protein n=1 Tax=Prevotella sp. E15-22 TaxID=2937774 RepID=UPI00204DCF29|nr:glycosyltransferase [Prevotella sp. E15-22]UPS45266.1 glycosyltransferase [Prevotella sp. E15-22]
MNNPFISVIVPVYNAESYLKGCLESILNQSYSNFELILVDDGSTDNSGWLCDNYATIDCRVRTLHKSNAGAGAARNDGLSTAKGEYIVFVDSDDKLSLDYFERLSKHDEDVVYIDVEDVNEKGQVIKHEYMSPYKTLPKMDFLRFQMTGSLPWGGVRKCVKKQFLIEKKIKFSNHKIGEEAIYSYQVLRFAKTIGFMEGVSYYCLLHDNSLSQTKLDDPLGYVPLDLREKVKENGDYVELGGTVNAFIKVAAASSVYVMAQKYPFLKFKRMAENRLQKMKSEIDSDVCTDYQHISRRHNFAIWFMEKRLWLPIWIVSRLRQ